MTTGVAVVSGGMDSVTMAHMLAEVDDLLIVSFDYGQRHVKELGYAQDCAKDLGARWCVIPMGFMANLLGGSALTDSSIDVPEGHYAEESMKATVVPNRNMIMLSIAVGIAVDRKADYVATAVHAGDHAIYPDCRPVFIDNMNVTAQLATEGFHVGGFQVIAPFVRSTKAEIVALGMRLKNPVDYSKTWSCYKGEEVHCGRCGTCIERAEAFYLAGVDDPTVYAG